MATIILTRKQKQDIAKYKKNLKKLPRRCELHHKSFTRLVYGCYIDSQKAQDVTYKQFEKSVYNSLHGCKQQVGSGTCYWEVDASGCRKVILPR